jgi:hypothetical protein
VILPVFQRDHFAIGWIAKRLQHFAGEHPVVSVQDARARFNDEAGHGEESLNQERRKAGKFLRFFPVFLLS